MHLRYFRSLKIRKALVCVQKLYIFKSQSFCVLANEYIDKLACLECKKYTVVILLQIRHSFTIYHKHCWLIKTLYIFKREKSFKFYDIILCCANKRAAFSHAITIWEDKISDINLLLHAIKILIYEFIYFC